MSDMRRIQKDFAEAMQGAKPKTSPYDTEAKVLRVEGETAWVHIAGGVNETPVALTINAQAGDTVRVRVSGGTAWITGNDSAPPTDDTTAEAAQETANTAQTIARTASLDADAAKKIAGNTNQYFWHTETGTDTGAHITEIPRDDFLADPANGGGNLLARSNGIAIRDGMDELATFGAGGYRIGQPEGARQIGDDHKWQIYSDNNYKYAEIVDIYKEYGLETITDQFTVNALEWEYGLSQHPHTTTDILVEANGEELTRGFLPDTPGGWFYGDGASGDRIYWDSGVSPSYKPAAGTVVSVTYQYYPRERSDMDMAYTFGFRTGSSLDDIGAMSFVEGNSNEASGKSSHAEGKWTTASGDYSHAENFSTTASGIASHASGSNTIASGDGSATFGRDTIATGDDQMVIGRHNEDQTGLFLIGNGITDYDRSNAVRVQESGITHFRTRSLSGTIGEDVPSGSVQLGGFTWYDKNADLVGYNQINRTAADALYMSLAVARNNAGGTQIRNGFYLDILADGTQRIRFYNADSRQAWLDALGIGEKETANPSAAISTTSGTAKDVASVSLSAGTWMVIGHVHYNAGGTAGTYRAARLGSTATGAQYGTAQVAGASGGNTNVHVMAIVTLSAAGTVYLSAQQGSGSNINVSTGSGIEAVKIGF